MIDKALEQVVVEAVVSAVVGAFTSAIIALIINKLLVRIINYWFVGVSIITLSLGLFLWTYLNRINYQWIVRGFIGVIIAFAIYKRFYEFPTVDVASCINNLGDNSIVKETLTSHFFRKANKYQKVHLDFRVYDKISKIEFRVNSHGSEHIVILDYVKLSRRLL